VLPEEVAAHLLGAAQSNQRAEGWTLVFSDCSPSFPAISSPSVLRRRSRGGEGEDGVVAAHRHGGGDDSFVPVDHAVHDLAHDLAMPPHLVLGGRRPFDTLHADIHNAQEDEYSEILARKFRYFIEM
jgi:hypothetical protein